MSAVIQCRDLRLAGLKLPSAVLLMLGLAACGGGGGSSPNQPDPNQAPVADAGPDLDIITGHSMRLDGSGSSDPDGDNLTFLWTLRSAPPGSTATLSGSSARPEFVPDQHGEYTVELVVSDGGLSSAPDVVSLTASNEPPGVTFRALDPWSEPELGVPFEFFLRVTDNEGDDVQCVFDPTGLGEVEIPVDDCTVVTGTYDGDDGRILTHTYTELGTFPATLRATDGIGETSGTRPVQVDGDIRIRFRVPDRDGDYVDDVLEPQLSINSVYDIAEVRVRLADVEVVATSAQLPAMDLSALDSGPYLLEATVTDVMGTEVHAYLNVILNRRPVLTIDTPGDYPTALALPDFIVQASCSDDDPEPCSVAVRRHAAPDTYRPPIILASAAGELDVAIDLQDWPTIVMLEVAAIDSVGQSTGRFYEVYTERSPRLTQVQAVRGAIVDLDDTRILSMDGTEDQPRLLLHDRLSGETIEVELPTSASYQIRGAFLTPTGVVYGWLSIEPEGDPQILEWRGDQLETLSDRGWSLTVNGDYAAFFSGPISWFWNSTVVHARQFSTGTSTSLEVLDATGLYPWPLAVAPDGVVGFGTTSLDLGTSSGNGPVYRFDQQSGEFGPISPAGGDDETRLWIEAGDGFFAYIRRTPSSDQYELVINDGTGEHVLNDFGESFGFGPSDPGRFYRVEQGWTAFLQRGNLSQWHAWLRSPTGDLSQVTFFGSSSELDGLGADGTVMLIREEERYLGDSAGSPQLVGSQLGIPLFVDGQWYVAIDRFLLRVD